MTNMYYVWVDLDIDDILAVKQNETSSLFLEQLKKENIRLSSVKASSTLDAIKKYKNTQNIHAESLFQNKSDIVLH